jgi:hypothetical protein
MPDTRCIGTDCPGCEAARRHYLATGCLVPNCSADHDAPDECIAPPGNLCTDTGCWDADRCVVTRDFLPAGGDA